MAELKIEPKQFDSSAQVSNNHMAHCSLNSAFDLWDSGYYNALLFPLFWEFYSFLILPPHYTILMHEMLFPHFLCGTNSYSSYKTQFMVYSVPWIFSLV